MFNKIIVPAFLLFFFQIGFSQDQDINLTGNGNDIFNGGTNSPSLNNNTAFGDVEANSNSQITFTIQNTKSGGSPHNNKLTVNNITISGSNASDFVVSGISFPTVINRSNSTTFIITFSPTLLSEEIASVSISSDDPDENPYAFNLSGTGIEAGTNPSLTLTNTYPLSVLEPSGLAFDKATNQLITVSDNSNLIYRISLTGAVLQTYGYTGDDLEGVSMYTPNKFLVAEERLREIIEYDYVNNTYITHAMTYNNTTLNDANSGIEGVTYNPTTGGFYFLNEKNPGALIEANSNFTVTNEYPLNYAGDYSGSYYVEETGFLWLASDQESTIYKCNTDGTVVNTFPVTTAGGTTIDKLEGIAIDHANQLLYAVSDLGQELYVFEINDPTIDPPTIIALGDTFPTLDGVSGETTSSSVLDNDTLHNLPATLAEVSLSAISILDPSNSPTTNIVLNTDGTVTVLSNTTTGAYSLRYEICELLDPANCSQVTNTISVLGPAPSTNEVIIAGDSWNYYDTENEPSGSWKTIAYDDSSWNTGAAVLGFNNGETTTLNVAAITSYFRKTIQITNASAITNIDVSAIRDDGMIVYVNGTEVWRDNMPTGAVSYSTQASDYIKDVDENTWINQSIANNLVEGDNVIAVEIHIKKPKGRNKIPDMSFDFTMTLTSTQNMNGQNIEKLNNLKTEDISLYPVPADHTLNISIGDAYLENTPIRIYDIYGVLVKNTLTSPVDVSNLKSGIYFVILTTDKNIFKKTIIIEHN